MLRLSFVEGVGGGPEIVRDRTNSFAQPLATGAARPELPENAVEVFGDLIDLEVCSLARGFGAPTINELGDSP